MKTKDHNYLKNVYLQTFTSHDNLGQVIESFDFMTTHKPEFKKQVAMLIGGRGSEYKKWNRLTSPMNFIGHLKMILDKLKASN